MIDGGKGLKIKFKGLKKNSIVFEVLGRGTEVFFLENPSKTDKFIFEVKV